MLLDLEEESRRQSEEGYSLVIAPDPRLTRLPRFGGESVTCSSTV